MWYIMLLPTAHDAQNFIWLDNYSIIFCSHLLIQGHGLCEWNIVKRKHITIALHEFYTILENL